MPKPAPRTRTPAIQPAIAGHDQRQKLHRRHHGAAGARGARPPRPEAAQKRVSDWCRASSSALATTVGSRTISRGSTGRP